MNIIILHEIGRKMEVYIDKIAMKAKTHDEHLKNLVEAFDCMHLHSLKLNTLKWAFGICIGNLLGLLVYLKGIEVNRNKKKTIQEITSPINKKEL